MGRKKSGQIQRPKSHSRIYQNTSHARLILLQQAGDIPAFMGQVQLVATESLQSFIFQFVGGHMSIA